MAAKFSSCLQGSPALPDCAGPLGRVDAIHGEARRVQRHLGLHAKVQHVGDHLQAHINTIVSKANHVHMPCTHLMMASICLLLSLQARSGEAKASTHLQVPLGLLEGSHDAKSAEEVSLGVCCYAWDDGVVGPLPGPQAVGVLGIQEEVVAPIMQREAAPLWDNAYNGFTTLFDDVEADGYLTRSGRLEEPFLGPRAILFRVCKTRLSTSRMAHSHELMTHFAAMQLQVFLAAAGNPQAYQIQRHTEWMPGQRTFETSDGHGNRYVHPSPHRCQSPCSWN